MRITELNAPVVARKWLNDVAWNRHEIQSEDPEYLAKLKQYGFTLAGEPGLSGAVFHKEGYPYVLKIFGFDEGYLDWYKYCKANQDNPYLPKIKGGLVKLEKKIFGVRLEPLVFKSDDIQRACYKELRAIIGNTVSGQPSSIKDGEYEYFDNDPALFKVIKAIRKLRAGNTLDIHEDNIMWRGDQVVITDPLRG